MPRTLPQSAGEFSSLSWAQIEPLYRELEGTSLGDGNLGEWLATWSRLRELESEALTRLKIATMLDTTDTLAQQRYDRQLTEVRERAQEADQKLKLKFLDAGQAPENFAIPLRNMQAEAALFREANLPLLTEEKKLVSDHDRLIGAQTVQWEGREVTLPQLQPALQEADRERRERAWRQGSERQLKDRDALSLLWGKFLTVRRDLALNAGCADYRTYRWQQQLRHDYTPEDCFRFQRAIEREVVPAAQGVYERRRQRLGAETLRPWDLEVDPLGRPPLRPYSATADLEEKCAVIFRRVDPTLGAYFESMRTEGLLDLENRKGKAPGGSCWEYAAERKPFIFMNAVGLHDDVSTLIHEGGHAFHVFESAVLPYHHQREVGLEFAEVASTAMQLLCAPYLDADQGGFYTREETARALVDELEWGLQFWPYMAVVDAFQHWAYENHAAAFDPAKCDRKWDELWGRFMPGVAWNGLERERMTGWQRKLHIFQEPFYYVEYGLALLGAVQVWRNSLADPVAALAKYRGALSLGGTVTLPELYRAAGAELSFGPAPLREAVGLMERTIKKLERVTFEPSTNAARVTQ